MTVYNSAYDTTALEGSKTVNVFNGWGKLLVGGQYGSTYRELGMNKIREVLPYPPFDSAVPPFGHPLPGCIDPTKHLDDHTKKEDIVIYTDVRRCLHKRKVDEQEISISNMLEYSLTLTRARLQYVWSTESPSTLRDASQYPLGIYALWISETIGARFALSAPQQYKLMILAAFFYQCLFVKGSELNDHDKNRIAGAIARNLRVNADHVYAIIDQIGGQVDSVDRFCEVAPEVTESIRLKELNRGIMAMMLKGTWLNMGNDEIPFVALEHPPTWIAMVYAALSVHGYHRTSIAKIATRLHGNTGVKEFTIGINSLMEDLIPTNH